MLELEYMMFHVGVKEWTWMKKQLLIFSKLLDIKLLHLENGTMECKPLITQIQEVLTNFTDFVLAIGEIILIQSWKKMVK